jgi:hypothetical protein
MSSQASLIIAFFGPDPNPTQLTPARVITQVPTPVVTFDGNTYTIMIFRKNGTWLKDFFGEHVLSVCSSHGEELKKLSMEPLKATTDPLKLKELEERFPGSTMVLSLPSRQGVVNYVYEDLYEDASINHMISCNFVSPFPLFDFATIGVEEGKRPQLMAEWRGMYIDLSHLF